MNQQTVDTSAPAAPLPTGEAMEAEFDRVFASLTSDEQAETATETKTEPETAEKSTETAAEEPKTEAKTEETPPSEAETEAKSEETSEEIDWKARFDALQAEVEALKSPKTPPEPQKQAETPQKQAETAQQQGYKFSDDETSTVKQYEEDWPEIAKAEAIRRRADMYNAVAYVFAEINKAYGPLLERAAQTAEIVDDQTVLSELRARHPDYDAVYDKVVAWTDTLPVAFKRAAKQVVQAGTVDEVTDLISTYKQAVGKVETPKPADATNLSDAAKKAAKALSVVSSKRSAVTAEDDPNDFEGAWKRATSSS
jgi:hypothetical protein